MAKKKSELNSLDTFEKFLREIQTNHDKVGALLSNHSCRKSEVLDARMGTIAQRRNTFHGKCSQSGNVMGRRTYIPESELSIGAKVTRARLAVGSPQWTSHLNPAWRHLSKMGQQI